MSLPRFATLAAAAVLAASTVVTAHAQSPAEGDWTVADGSGRVRIAACADQLCGWVVDTDAASGTGRQLLTAFRGGPVVWTGGKIIDPKSGRRYQGRIAVLGSGRLQVTGCLVAPFCASQVWTRASSAAAPAETRGF